MCDQVVEAWMAVFQQSHPVAEAECFILFSAIANCAEANFVRYMQVIEPHLLKALSDAENYHVCCMAIGLVGDISRAIGQQLTNNGLCDKIMEALLKLLQNENLDRSVKPPVLGAFGYRFWYREERKPIPGANHEHDDASFSGNIRAGH